MYNKIQLMGRLTAAPELKTSKNGVPYTQFSIAVNRRFHAKGEESKVDFFNITAWRTKAEFICKYFTKGNMIMLDGELQTERYEDRNGNPATWYSVVVDNVSFTGEKTGGGNYNGGGYNNSRRNNNGNRQNYGGGNMFEQAQQIYGQPPVNNANNGYGNGNSGNYPPAPPPPPNDDYPF